jgi:hypothetical protein
MAPKPLAHAYALTGWDTSAAHVTGIVSELIEKGVLKIPCSLALGHKLTCFLAKHMPFLRTISRVFDGAVKNRAALSLISG